MQLWPYFWVHGDLPRLNIGATISHIVAVMVDIMTVVTMATMAVIMIVIIMVVIIHLHTIVATTLRLIMAHTTLHRILAVIMDITITVVLRDLMVMSTILIIITGTTVVATTTEIIATIGVKIKEAIMIEKEIAEMVTISLY